MEEARKTMEGTTQRLARLGISTADILIPKQGVDLKKWAVVACDQYTSQPEYWKRVNEEVGDAPSTLRLIFPEVYLNDTDKVSRIEYINQTMRRYLDEGLFDTYEDGFFSSDAIPRRIGADGGLSQRLTSNSTTTAGIQRVWYAPPKERSSPVFLPERRYEKRHARNTSYHGIDKRQGKQRH